MRPWTQGGGELQVPFMAAASRATCGELGPCPRCRQPLRCYYRLTRPERDEGILWLWCGACRTVTTLSRVAARGVPADPFAGLSRSELVELELSTAEPFLDRLERLWSAGQLVAAADAAPRGPR